MGKDYSYNNESKKSPERKVHPVWRGIGCVFMILNPIMAYAGMILLLDLNRQNGWMSIPKDLILEGNDSLLLVKVVIFLVILFFLFGFSTLFTFLIQRIAGPSRFGLYDVPPAIYKGKRYKR